LLDKQHQRVVEFWSSKLPWSSGGSSLRARRPTIFDRRP